jgi:hypothetical protein
MFGLNTDPDSDSNYTSIDFAIYATPAGDLMPYASGNYANGGSSIGTYAAGDILGVMYDGTSVYYMKNGAVLYSCTPPRVTSPLYFDSSFYTPGATLSNIRFGPMSSNNWASVGGAGKPADYATVSAADAATALGFNPQFSNWTDIYPAGWIAWTGPYPVKETSTVRTAPYAVKYTVSGNTGAFTYFNFATPLPAGTFVQGAYDINVILNNGGGYPGYLIRLFTNSSQTVYTDTIVPVPDKTVTGWQRVPFSARVPSGQQIWAIFIYQMAAWDGMPGGLWANGSVCVFDNLAFDLHDSSVDNNTLVPSINSAATTATWSGVSGTGKPADNATVGASWGSNISGQPADSALFNSYVSLSSNGALQGAGGGQVQTLPVVDGARTVNYAPQDYGVVHVKEFKQCGSIGISSASAMYCVLETMKPWIDNSGGYATQWAYVSSTEVWKRSGGCGDASWGSWVRDLDRNLYTGDLNATSGAPAGTNVGSTPATTVEANAANGQAAYNAVNDGTTGLSSCMRNNTFNVLSGGAGYTAGTITYNATTGARDGGYGVVMNKNGIAAWNSGDKNTFSLDATTGNASFAGTLTAATGSFAGSLSAATGTFAGALSAATGSFAGSLSAVTGNFYTLTIASGGYLRSSNFSSGSSGFSFNSDGTAELGILSIRGAPTGPASNTFSPCTTTQTTLVTLASGTGLTSAHKVVLTVTGEIHSQSGAPGVCAMTLYRGSAAGSEATQVVQWTAQASTPDGSTWNSTTTYVNATYEFDVAADPNRMGAGVYFKVTAYVGSSGNVTTNSYATVTISTNVKSSTL